MADAEQLDRLAALLRDAHQIVVLTGAGISTESGIPDFRGPQGIWTKDPKAERKCDDPALRRGRRPPPRRLAQPRRQRAVRRASPTRGTSRSPSSSDKANVHTLVTQNVDGLHQAAGSSPEIVIEIHGTVHEVKCLQCGWRGPMEDTVARVRAGDEDPACLECGGMLKSATISFGENLVPEDLMRAQRAADGADVFLAVGTSLGVYPAAALPEHALPRRRHAGGPQRRGDALRRRRRVRVPRPPRRGAARPRGPGVTQGSGPLGNTRPLR